MSALKTFGGGKRRPINLFFAEIIIALLFFSISGAVIVKVFASAELRSQRSARLERVMLTAQSLAEAYSQSGDIESAARLVLGADGYRAESGADCFYIEGGSVTVRTAEERIRTGAGELKELTMTFAEDDGEIFSLTCSAYTHDGGERVE
ncbi:MAG: hypothetical protein NC299_07170 [Lachnospiraceae bacterium]|nr:hypothetical protein [Ruminococcus sp.]MCM1275135.1 hypothetical protein [Lachnospiraceae bacterium]